MKRSMCLDRVTMVKSEWQPRPLVRIIWWNCSTNGRKELPGMNLFFLVMREDQWVIGCSSGAAGSIFINYQVWLQQLRQSLSTTTSGREANRSGIWSSPCLKNYNHGNCFEVRHKTTATNEEGQRVHVCWCNHGAARCCKRLKKKQQTPPTRKLRLPSSTANWLITSSLWF